MDIELEIEGVSERTIADAIRKRVRNVARRITGPGEWRISIAPSETRGEWDLGILGSSAWHLDSFTVAVDQLPAVIEERLRERLMPPMADVSSAGGSGRTSINRSAPA